MALHDINPDRVPTPPYTDLQAALAAFDELVDNVAGVVPVALDDVTHRYGVEVDSTYLPFSDSDDTDRMGGHLEGRNRARRMFARALVERLLADDDIVLYPVPQPRMDTAGHPVPARLNAEPMPPADSRVLDVVGDWWQSSHGVAIATTRPTDYGPGLIVDGRYISPVDAHAIREYFLRDLDVDTKAARS